MQVDPQNEQNLSSVMGTGFDTLRHIENQAAAHDREAFGQFDDQQATQEPEQSQDSLIEAQMVYMVARAALVPLYPCIEKIYTDDQIKNLATVTAPLLDKYGLSSGGILAKWAPEFAFIVTVAPLAMQTVQAIREERAAAQAKDVSNDAHASEAA